MVAFTIKGDVGLIGNKYGPLRIDDFGRFASRDVIVFSRRSRISIPGSALGSPHKGIGLDSSHDLDSSFLRCRTCEVLETM